ncbi:MAG: hypothetical protein Q8R26_03685 [bacterium]|nr:hypothetical protein [bacterium]
MRTKKTKIWLWLGVVALLNGCAAVGSRITVNTNGPSLSRSRATVYNNAGKKTTLTPFSHGGKRVAEYVLGKRDPLWLWLQRKKIPTQYFILRHGEFLQIPFRLNLTGRWIQESISVLVEEDHPCGGKRNAVGTWTWCVNVPPNQPIVKDLHFGKRELGFLKEGHPGYPCDGDYLGWYYPY